MIVRPSAWVLAIAVVVAGCGGQRGQARAAPAPLRVTGEPESLRFSSPLGVDLQFMRRTPSGLYYLDSQIGKGPAAAHGNRVKVAYQGWLADGKLFDSSDDGFQFLLGRGQVIPGWDEGVEGMRVGGRRLLVIRPSLAYGRQSPGAGIPPNATLVFDVHLLGLTP